MRKIFILFDVVMFFTFQIGMLVGFGLWEWYNIAFQCIIGVLYLVRCFFFRKWISLVGTGVMFYIIQMFFLQWNYSYQVHKSNISRPVLEISKD